MRIIDTHQHLWNQQRLQLPWLQQAPEILKRNYDPIDYREATAGYAIETIYMEVDVAASDKDREAEYVIGLCRDPAEPMVAAVIGGHPGKVGFREYVARHAASGVVRGVRQVLHDEASPRGTCLEKTFVENVEWLGEKGLSFDLCMRPADLDDVVKLAHRCPHTQLILDHCGNADPTAFFPDLAGAQPPQHDAQDWRRAITAIAGCANVVCKISGIVARAPSGWRPEHLQPIVDHCLNCFGPNRVVFGGDWPVCLLGSPLAGWIEALRTIVASRDEAEQRKLWYENAIRLYRLESLVRPR